MRTVPRSSGKEASGKSEWFQGNEIQAQSSYFCQRLCLLEPGPEMEKPLEKRDHGEEATGGPGPSVSTGTARVSKPRDTRMRVGAAPNISGVDSPLGLGRGNPRCRNMLDFRKVFSAQLLCTQRGRTACGLEVPGGVCPEDVPASADISGT